MAIRNKYQLMAESIVVDSEGNAYPDLATFPLNSFVANTISSEYKLTYNDTQRFFDLIYGFYSSFDFYDDIILWLNDIYYISDSENNFGRTIKIYGKGDVDNWYIASVRGETVTVEKRVVV